MSLLLTVAFALAQKRAAKALVMPLSSRCVELEDVLAKAERRAEEYFTTIEEVLKERDTWKTLYEDQARGHQNAQNLMMRQITTLVNMYQRETKKPVRLPPILDAVFTEWNANHGEEARKLREEEGK